MEADINERAEYKGIPSDDVIHSHVRYAKYGNDSHPRSGTMDQMNGRRAISGRAAPKYKLLFPFAIGQSSESPVCLSKATKRVDKLSRDDIQFKRANILSWLSHIPQ
jgi:hypothetical protein